ncbi:MAG: YMGG-like glycine zipper-containing protein [Gammaproteobacteria bacterium]
MNSTKLVIILLAILGLSACAGMTDTQQRTVTGGLGGAGLGAVIGAIAGDAGMGAAIGAAAGTAGGYLYGKHKEAEQKAYNQGRMDEYKQQQYQQPYPR